MLVYYCLLTIKVEKSKHFIEIGCDYHLPFHPNLTDQIEIMGFPAKITEIYYCLEDLHNSKHAVIKFRAIDCVPVYEDDEEGAIKFLKDQFNEIKKCTPDLILNDWSFDAQDLLY